MTNNSEPQTIAPTPGKPRITRAAYNQLKRNLKEALAAEEKARARVADIEKMMAAVEPEPEPEKKA